MVAEVADIREVTTRSKGKTMEWETQEAIRKQATEWVKKANEWNVAELEQQNEKPEEVTDTTQSENPTWQAIKECQILLPLGRLLQLVPQFTDGLKSGITTSNPLPALAFFSNPKVGPAGLDRTSQGITTIVK